jgi:hypothetical protein
MSFDPSVLELQATAAAEIQAYLVAGSKQPWRDLQRPRAALQRLEPVAGGGCTNADCHEAAVGFGNRRLPEWRLYEVLRSQDLRDPDGAAPPIASPSPGLVVPN